MIKIHKNDSIVDIIIKIKNNEEKEVVLEFPFWHPILHNYTSLKILKNKVWNKDLIIITNDINAKKIWKPLWIKYSIIDNPDLVGYNYTFFEYLIYTFKNYFRELKDFLFHRRNDGLLWKYQKKLVDSKLRYFISILFLSIILLIFIFYFAVNKTYIYITPKIEVREKAKNFIFTELNEDDFITEDNVIRLKKIEKTISITDKFATSWIKADSITNSRWKVTLYNLLWEEVELVNNTRVQTDDWLVFLVEWPVKIPKAMNVWTEQIIPWTIDVYANARVNDNSWRITGIRGNIEEWIKMFLPWLKENKENIYAISSSKFNWGSDNYIKILASEDIENAKILLKWKIEAEILKQVRNELDEDNKLNNVQYEILWINDIIKFSDFEVYWVENYKVWEEIENFELSATIKISTYAYNKGLLITKMRNDILNSVLESVEEVQEINANSLRVTNILDRKTNPFTVKATAIIQVYVVHNFLNKDNNYVDRLKSVVAWLDNEEAQKILINNSRISNARIDVKPFFMSKISKLTDNIIFKVEKR